MTVSKYMVSLYFQSELVVRAEEDAAALRQANEDLCRQVEGLQSSRFSEVEELVYLRWVNACLRYELLNARPQDGKSGALDLSSTSGRKASRLIGKLKRWGTSKKDRCQVRLPTARVVLLITDKSSIGFGTPRSALESLMLRNASDGTHEIMAFGTRKDDSPTNEGGKSPSHLSATKVGLKPMKTKEKFDFSGVAASFNLVAKIADPSMRGIRLSRRDTKQLLRGR
ncbi:hypothetical protein R1flu_008637 [Riccia fluitans]|uniref:Uncharacterized protein n=1 Tax=Riccia fluitans TaxID=41844 RepID=A0ABD1YFV2_9MARC